MLGVLPCAIGGAGCPEESSGCTDTSAGSGTAEAEIRAGRSRSRLSERSACAITCRDDDDWRALGEALVGLLEPRGLGLVRRWHRQELLERLRRCLVVEEPLVGQCQVVERARVRQELIGAGVVLLGALVVGGLEGTVGRLELGGGGGTGSVLTQGAARQRRQHQDEQARQ